jgi:DNA-3-methyladenine glycosylase II
MQNTFTADNFTKICDHLASIDPDLAVIIEKYGYPPMWRRSNSFESLLHIILEQQVSLASALATLSKLKEKISEVTPANLLALSDDELRACYFSRQKAAYSRSLAQAIESKNISLAALPALTNDEIRMILAKLKGIGNWTIDIYLMFVLQRADIFPIRDLAAVNALKKIKALPTAITTVEMLRITAQWQPHRTIATMILWHFYLSSRK